MNTIKITDILGSELRTRKMVSALANITEFDTILDFSNVIFMSRSFADELYNLRVKFPGIGFINMIDSIQSMFRAVVAGRQHDRIRSNSSNSSIETIEDLNELNDFFNSIK